MDHQTPALASCDIAPFTEADEGFLLVDKETGPSSFHIVSRVKRMLRSIGAPKRIKVGHGGTLDPFASGLLILFIGKKYTQKAAQALGSEKSYIAKLQLGFATDSFDHTGQVTHTSDIEPKLEDIHQTLKLFQSHCLQTPPVFSAKKIDGQRLYHYARAGKEVEIPSQKVWMQSQVLHYDYPHLVLRVRCSKGTYLRSLANDIGTSLGCFAHLTQLYRDASLSFSLPTETLLSQAQNASQIPSPHNLRNHLNSLQESTCHCDKLPHPLPLLFSEQLDKSHSLAQRIEDYRACLCRHWPGS